VLSGSRAAMDGISLGVVGSDTVGTTATDAVPVTHEIDVRGEGWLAGVSRRATKYASRPSTSQAKPRASGVSDESRARFRMAHGQTGAASACKLCQLVLYIKRPVDEGGAEQSKFPPVVPNDRGDVVLVLVCPPSPPSRRICLVARYPKPPACSRLLWSARPPPPPV
jgi:hypothetical protein